MQETLEIEGNDSSRTEDEVEEEGDERCCGGGVGEMKKWFGKVRKA